MTSEDAKKLKHGLYRLRWEEGGESMAAVGYLADGTTWFCCCNWISGTCTDWSKVVGADLLYDAYTHEHVGTPPPPVEPVAPPKNGGPVAAFAAKLAHVLEARAKQHVEEACRIRIALNSDPSRTAAAAAARDDTRAEVFLELAELVREAMS